MPWRRGSTQSSVLAWKIPWTEESGGLQSLGSQKSQTRLKQLNSSSSSRWLSGEESACNAGDAGSIPGSGKIPWRRKLEPTPVFLPGKFHGQRSLVDYSLWGHKRVRHNLASEQRQQLIWHSTKIHNLYFSILVSLFQIPISLPPHAFFFNLI